MVCRALYRSYSHCSFLLVPSCHTVSTRATDSLVEAWTSALLKNDAKFVPLTHRPIYGVLEAGLGSLKQPMKSLDRMVLLWYFEDQLHKRYNRFTKRLHTLLQEQDSDIKRKTLTIVSNLLANYPEGEQVRLIW